MAKISCANNQFDNRKPNRGISGAKLAISTGIETRTTPLPWKRYCSLKWQIGASELAEILPLKIIEISPVFSDTFSLYILAYTLSSPILFHYDYFCRTICEA